MAGKLLFVSFLLISAFASENAPNPVDDFMDGFSIGVNQPMSCSDNWKMCGVYAGQLMGMPTSDLISLFTQRIPLSGALEIVEGFQASFSSIWGCISTVIDVGTVAYDIYHFTTPSFQNESILKKVSDVLNFSCSVQKTAFDFVFIMNTCGARANLSLEFVAQNYKAHHDEVASLMVDVNNCENNYRQCGKSAGDLIQLLLQ
mmetsp:Transcript_4069/g.3911  ORF Transcript_4069/g.3911 Transcript_4069/m.3911 type:complete len:202 (-) Transcript_4069:37-642(-)|eukprot:CAMPEP_0202947328 /NCGR_PEP_ID=MMETSP1395-20130829/11510_1 /ASSEMBLY_ACC=CAM_ASM_000871 /TAXON_ID=5961 /ORGANISM="Blepharisma japonicum, Strain Stock R1072" /LENGTH=201 /DNA_ID=CAMNT_0049648517 /DNA_START=8 /DNA_END=613 /DNA_ORIENTATION=-